MNNLNKIRGHLMTGVSYMIPVIVAGGVTLAISVLISGSPSVPDEGIAGDLAQIGIFGLSLMVPVLSGYIAFSMVDRPGLAPGLIGGVIANEIGAGFLGGIISGLLAGITVKMIRKIPFPRSFQSVIPILIIPLFSTTIVGLLMIWVIGIPIKNFMDLLTNWLMSMGTNNLALLGLILGAMIASDMGGPINKVAFSFGTALVGTVDSATGLPNSTGLVIMAGIGAAIAIPPLGAGLATLISPNKFSTEEIESGKAALVMGAMGITEGAIPFAAADPIRVIPANMIGGAVGAAITIWLGAGNPAPWGGIIVAPVCQKFSFYLLGMFVGTVITAAIIILSKSMKQADVEKDENVDEIDIEIEFMS